MVVAKDHVPYTEHVGLRFTREDMKELKKIAKRKRVQVSILIRMVIGDFLNKEAENSNQT